jgi:hypothetical protein
MAFYLCRRDGSASPHSQVLQSKKDTGYHTGFRVTFRKGAAQPFQWQEQGPDGLWRDISVWSNMVHCDCSRRMGYKTPDYTTTAAKGSRTRGTEHTVGEAPDALTALAEAFQAAENAEKAESEPFPDAVGHAGAPTPPPPAPL